MNQKKKLLILALGLVVLLAGAAVLYNSLSGKVDTDQMAQQPAASSAGEEVDYSAPDFTAYDGDGNPVRLSDYVGKPIVLNFWASWCGPCKSEMPEFHEVYLDMQDEIQFLMVNATTSQRESQEQAQAYIDQEGYTFPVLFDLDSQGVMTYGAYSLPSTFFINADGDLVTYATGAINKELLLKGIGMIQ